MRLSPVRLASLLIRTSWFTRSKELLQVQVHHPAAAALHLSLGLRQRLVGALARPKPKAEGRETWVVFRFQHLQKRLLDEAVYDGGDAQLSRPAIRLGYLYPLHRLRPVGALKQLLLQARPLSLQVARKLLDGHPVYPWTTLVCSYSPERQSEIRP
jgi:hypothetical protein